MQEKDINFCPVLCFLQIYPFKKNWTVEQSVHVLVCVYIMCVPGPVCLLVFIQDCIVSALPTPLPVSCPDEQKLEQQNKEIENRILSNGSILSNEYDIQQ